MLWNLGKNAEPRCRQARELASSTQTSVWSKLSLPLGTEVLDWPLAGLSRKRSQSSEPKQLRRTQHTAPGHPQLLPSQARPGLGIGDKLSQVGRQHGTAQAVKKGRDAG